jgi:hypothetical protein
MDAINFKVYPENKSQIKTIKAVFKAFKIKFEVEEKKPYNQEFVTRVLEAKQEIKQGKGKKIAIDDLWK